MRETLSRRRFVEAAGAASIFALAGCTDSENGGDGGENASDGEDGNGTNETNETNESDGLGGDGNESNESDDETGNESNETDDEQTQAIRLGAETAGWQGQAPNDIEDETNPTISLQAGTTYDLTWENLDGEEHELIAEDADGNEIAASDESEQEGETVSMTLEITQEMAGRSGTYYCEYHPEAMRGEFSVE
ncbi:cupredoxin domain-containing protein [Halalkalicoccus ordinarius]|uniref:cupredoxin domain-containing protein n=1 Tax=Halalkalicoccus ordinarius TaxID=3116651 RepID=UPI00300EFA61